MDILKELPDNAFSLAIVDPPYGITNNSNRHGGSGSGKLKNRVLNKNAKEFKDWDVRPEKEYFKELFRVSQNQIIWGGNYFELPPTRGIICWDKCQPWENFSQVELAWTSFNKPAKLFRLDNRTGEKIHPTQKPVKLYEWLLLKYAKEGDTILDTHFGSLSVGIACHNLGFELTAIEIDKCSCSQAIKRLRIHQKQLKLF